MQTIFVSHLGLTSHYQLSREVCGGCGVGGNAGVAPAVGGREAEEEDVAAEHVVLHLHVLPGREVFAVFVPLDVDGHVARGDGAGHLRPVS